MRGIKFRAWDIVDNKMMLENNFWLYRNFEFARKSKKLSLMQYTGLKDKNGVEIYEGDIVDSRLFGICEVKYYLNAFVLWASDGSNSRDASYLHETCEVIGNIHENKELLEVE